MRKPGVATAQSTGGLDRNWGSHEALACYLFESIPAAQRLREALRIPSHLEPFILPGASASSAGNKAATWFEEFWWYIHFFRREAGGALLSRLLLGHGVCGKPLFRKVHPVNMKCFNRMWLPHTHPPYWMPPGNVLEKANTSVPLVE